MLASCFELCLELVLLGCLFPAAWARLEHCAVAGAIVGDAARCRNACASKCSEVLSFLDPLCELFCLLLEFFRGVEVLLLLFFSLDCCVCHLECSQISSLFLFVFRL